MSDIFNIFQKKFFNKKFTRYTSMCYFEHMSLLPSQAVEVTDEDRIELQSHFPYAGVKLSELSVQDVRLILYFLRGMSQAAAGRAAGYKNQD